MGSYDFQKIGRTATGIKDAENNLGPNTGVLKRRSGGKKSTTLSA